MFTDIGHLDEETQADIRLLQREGITEGTSPTTFDPDGDVSRWQMAKFLARMLRRLDPS